MKKVSKTLLSVLLATSMFGCSKGSTTSSKMKAGTYTVSEMGMNDKVEVSVEVDETRIKSVKVTKHSETPGIGGELKDSKGQVMRAGGVAPVELIPQEIVKNQSLKVDNVTGATITSAAIVRGVEKAIKDAGGNPDSFKKTVNYEARKDVSADVAVLGGGGAGLAAAIGAAQKGKKVVIIEKAGAIGGDTLVCGAIYNAPDPAMQSKVKMSATVKTTIEKALSEKPVNEAHKALQAEVQKQWNTYKSSGQKGLFDTKEWYALQTWINGDKVANLELVKVLCYQSYGGMAWIQKMGMTFKDSISQGAGSLWQRTHTSTMPMGTGFMSVYAKQLDSLKDKISFINEAKASKLIMKDGKAVGAVVVDNHTKKEFKVEAKDGVVLATGGFAANAKMVQEYNKSGKWQDLSKTASTNRFSSSQGDGIVMAKEAGASLTDMEQIQLLYLGNTKDGQLTKYPARAASGTDQILFVNKEGKRFVREDGRRDEICLNVLKQKDAMFYIVESADGPGYKDIKDPNWRSADGFTFKYLEENGYVVSADTLEELAKKLKMNPATLKASVDQFNASVDSGKDEFGRTLYTTKLTKGPWVATSRQACIHHTMGGITIDTMGRVLNESKKPIANLYAAGEVTGGIHGGNRLGGNAVVDTVVFGKLVSDTLVADHK
ncbi:MULTISPECIES: FAD-dependent oxidoreductase [Terrabacteria group]|uniref:FAD-dependent oxidoreductase n=1 Tax=Bacillati TaxID=1783272 RepID=UPI001C6E0D8C|nr:MULTISPECIES: FAD-dependent oxidoreductase [Terrabacteria group]MBW9212141.1 FAD-dependent oxidoreductase [Trueperella sp. zg.1013]